MKAPALVPVHPSVSDRLVSVPGQNRQLLLSLVLVLLAATSATAQQVTLKAGDATGAPGSEVEVPVLISGSQKAGPMQFILDYDPQLLEAVPDAPGGSGRRSVTFGSMIGGGMIAQNSGEPGEVKIALRTDEPIAKDGELLRVRFKVKGGRGHSCTLNILVPEMWEKESLFEVPVRTESGKFTVGGLAPWLWAAIAAATALLLFFLLWLLLFRKRKNKRPAPDEEDAPAIPAPAAAARPRATRAAAPAPAPAPVLSPADEAIALLKKLKELRDADLISAEDFDAKKKELLGRM